MSTPEIKNEQIEPISYSWDYSLGKPRELPSRDFSNGKKSDEIEFPNRNTRFSVHDPFDSPPTPYDLPPVEAKSQTIDRIAFYLLGAIFIGVGAVIIVPSFITALTGNPVSYAGCILGTVFIVAGLIFIKNAYKKMG